MEKMESEVVNYDCNNTEMLSLMSYTELQEHVLKSSRLFTVLYDQHRGGLETTLIKLTETANHGHQVKIIIFGGLSGAVIGTSIGSVIGVLSGAFGAVCAVFWSKMLGNVSQYHASLGFIGGTIGGGAGATVGSAVCGAVGSALALVGCSVHSKAGLFACAAVGYICGGAIGKCYGGKIGEVSSGMGGAFGAVCGAGAAVCIIRGIADFSRSVADLKKVYAIQKTGKEFHDIIKPLEKELKTIEGICDTLHKMSFSPMMQSVASQSGNALAAVSMLSKTITGIESHDLEVTVSIQQLPRQCKETREELEKMRAAHDIFVCSFEVK